MSGSRIKTTLDNFLVVDFFVVAFGFLWFVLGFTGAILFRIDAPYTLWTKLWQPLFQPALGILMLGAVVSGLWGWIKSWPKR
jgi:hypothetical protein